MNKKLVYQIVGLFVFAMLFSGCAKYNASFLKQGYHDLTARYNANFNAKQKYKLSIKQLESNRKDNFDEIIPLYAFGTIEDTKKMASDFDVVIDKASRSIQLHKISNWSDDNFLLLGKAFYMKDELDKSIESLRYITANYKNGVDGRSKKKIKKQKRSKKRKKRAKRIEKRNVQKLKAGKDIRPKKSIFKHQPTKSEALVWLVNAFTAQEKYNEAQAVLDYINLDNTFIQNYDREKELAQANYLIQQNLYNEAIPHLKSAIEKYKSNKKKARYRFVLAQLLQKTGNKTASVEYFEKSIKGNSNYDMIFNARLKALKLSSGNKNTDKEKKLLAKLIRDSKNVAYLDQLYYEKALLALNGKDTEKAKEYLNLSIEKSVSNDKQKAKSYILLGDIFYDKENYTKAQENYAASLPLISEEFENYAQINKKASVLTELVSQLNTISKSDSLLGFANMPVQKRERVLYEQALAIVEKEKEAKEQKKAIVDKFAANDKVATNNSKFYFYNTKLKEQGYAKFIALWGDRKLEDDWRRANKTTNLDFADESKTEEELFDEKVNTLYDQMLAEVPKDEKEIGNLKSNVAKAHYTAANIYKYDLESESKAIYHYNKIAADFTDSKYDAESLYNLYILNKENNAKLANKNKNLVLTKYPNSSYAKIIKDPSFAETLKQNTQKVDAFYEATYQKYLAEDYASVISRVEEARKTYGKNPLEAKFALLEAITLGKQKKYKPYVDALEGVIADYKDTEEEAKASEMLAYLKGEMPKKETQTPSLNNNEKASPNTSSSSSIFDPNKDKDKEGFKVNFGKNEILNVGTSSSKNKKESEVKKEEKLKENTISPSKGK